MKNSTGIILSVVAFAISAMTAHFNPAHAGCKINVFAKNTGKKALIMRIKYTGVRIKASGWRKLYNGGWKYSRDRALSPGQKLGGLYKGLGVCASKRRYRVEYTCMTTKNFTGKKHHYASTFIAYHPSSSGWTKKTTVTVNLPLCK